MGAAKLHRSSVEVLILSSGPAKLHRSSAEVLILTSGPAKLYRSSAEILYNPNGGRQLRWGSRLKGDYVDAYGAAVQADAPDLWLRYDEEAGTTASDSSGHARHFTYQASPTLGQPGLSGPVGHAAKFAGSQYASGAHGAALNPTGPWTIEVIAKMDALPGAGISPAFLTHHYSGSNLPMVLGFNLNNANTGLLGVGFFNGTWRVVHYPTPLTVGQRYHIVGIWDGATLRLRVNGAEVATSAPGSSPSASNQATIYQGMRWDNAQFIQGTVDEVAVYLKRLSDERANAHYAAIV